MHKQLVWLLSSRSTSFWLCCPCCQMFFPHWPISRAFQRKEVDFTVVKALVQGTKATVDALLMTPGEHFKSLPTVLPELREFGVGQPSDFEVQDFKRNVYEKYLIVLSRHITGRFPDFALFEGFGIFDSIGIPQYLTTHATHGADKFCILTNHYGQYGVIKSQVELKTLSSVVASNVELKRMSVHQLMSSHLVKSEELKLMFPNLAKLATIGLLLSML